MVTEKEKRRSAGRPSADATDLPTEAEILSRGLAAFAELGYEATSVRELSRRLGVSHNFINDRYGSKDAFWKMLIDSASTPAFEPLRKILLASYDDEVERFRDGVRGFLGMALANPNISRIINQESGSGGPRLEYVYARHVEPIVHALRPIFDRLVAEGRVRAVPLHVMMFAVIAMTGVTRHHGILELIGSNDGTPDRVLSEQLSEIVLDGLILDRSSRGRSDPAR
jgi:AcrR family transcriptional regulator